MILSESKFSLGITCKDVEAGAVAHKGISMDLEDSFSSLPHLKV